MNIMRRDPRTMFPDLIDWFEEPFLTLRPYMGQAIRIEDYTEDGHYVVRAEIAGIDPEKELEIATGSGRTVPALSRTSTARSSGTARSAAPSNCRAAPTARTSAPSTPGAC
jgi:HSP20 family molecular chaperone IbpA